MPYSVSRFVTHPSSALLAGYRTIPGVPDELVEPSGTIRAVWGELIAALEAMEPGELAHRIARGEQYLRDAGVFYRQYGAEGTPERDWPLSAMPVLIDETEWGGISAGLIQRANLLEAVVADVYGENSLVANGHIPAALIAQNPEWLRPLVGVKPHSGHFLHFVAFDLGRGPDGKWWVLGDRAQAPSGAGFALENRIATARIYADHYGRAHVHRLAGFFRSFRNALMGLREGDGSRVGILTPGPMNDTYYEHAYIARYLGLMLLEGEDMLVQNGQLMVRTVAGLRPISVLWRRLDAAWADPLELNESSRLGTPGLLNAARTGTITLINALGTGILETRALLAFLPRVAQALLGEDLALPNIATWWCGQAVERDYVKNNAARMTIGGAFETHPIFDREGTSAIAGQFTRDMPYSLEDWIEREGHNLVGQEAVTLSTTPVIDGDVLAPRPMSLRVFLARTEQGWQVMPGGFARIGRAGDSAILAMQQGGSVADVWIVSHNPVSTETLLQPSITDYDRQQPSVLPSRAADNLFWLGRYVERVEDYVRLLRAYHIRLAESARDDSPLLLHLAEYLRAMGVDPDVTIPSALVETLDAAIRAASHVRDRFSVDGWLALNDLAKTLRKMQTTASAGDDMARAMGVILRKLSGFSGLVNENMYRFTGWRFLSLGRSLERAVSLTHALSHYTDAACPEGGLDLVIEIADSVMTHRRVYAMATNRANVVDLLALDPLNPRAILYQLNQMSEHIRFLPGSDAHRPRSPLQRAMMEAQTGLAVHIPDQLNSQDFKDLGKRIATLSDHISAAYLR